jgi:hypothetical protein
VLVHNGIVYCRLNTVTGKEYIGKADTEENYKQRKYAHAHNNSDAIYTYTELFTDDVTIGKDLLKLEQVYIDLYGGPSTKSNPTGVLENKRNNFRKTKKKCGC